MDRGCRWPFFFNLRPPPKTNERGFACSRLKDFFLKSRVPHNSGHQRQPVRPLRGYPMFKAVLACPLRYPAREIYFTPADLPSLVSEFDDNPHRAGIDDAPLTFGHIGNLDDLSVNQSAHGSDS